MINRHSSSFTCANSPLRVSRSMACLICFGLILLLTLPGCSGCPQLNPTAWRKKKQEEAKKKKKEEEPKEPFTFGRLRVQPTDQAEIVRNEAKPGHWLTAVQPIKANEADFHGQLEAATVKRTGKLFDIRGTLYQLSLSRPAPLPKGQAKFFEALHYIPQVSGTDQNKTIWLRSTLKAARGGREVASGMMPTVRMPGHQSFFVVLSNEPESYGYVQRLDAVMPPAEDYIEEDRTLFYRVMLAKVGEPVPLPSQALTWTTIAYVLWDGIHPQSLTVEQQQAMLDWLHWGGQLIISGPNSLDTLRGSFLDPYLPARKTQAVELTQGSFTSINEHWSLTSRRKGQRLDIQVLDDQPVPGVELAKEAEAQFLPQTGELVAERRIGAGRTVVTAFPLSDRSIVNWGSLDNFFNSGLLRRPPRQFSLNEVNLATVTWSDLQAGSKDPRVLSTLRYFTRDVASPTTGLEQGEKRVGAGPDDWHFGGYGASDAAGVAAWDDRSGASEAARRTLREAAGISIPRSDFVLQVVAIYLLVLVPVNWAIFRLMGRVEWAWVAAPVIAIVSAVVVVRVAQLDIGFARSLTQLNVLEIQADYPRAHLTRYTALYTSLSTAYDVQFSDRSALALPFPADPNATRGLHDPIKRVTLRRDKTVVLEDFQVDSNSTGLIHSEEMLDLPGGLQLAGDQQGWRLLNQSPLSWQGVGILRRTEAGALEGAWVGLLSPKTAVALEFQQFPADRPWFDQWEEDPMTARSSTSDAAALRLAHMMELTTQQLVLWPGDVRMVGWTDSDLPGMTTHPESSQSTVRTLVVAHLRRAPLPDPLMDVNLRSDLAELDLTDGEQLELDAESLFR